MLFFTSVSAAGLKQSGETLPGYSRYTARFEAGRHPASVFLYVAGLKAITGAPEVHPAKLSPLTDTSASPVSAQSDFARPR